MENPAKYVRQITESKAEKFICSFFNKALIFSKHDLISQFTNISKINPDNYFFGQKKEITHNFDKFNIESVKEKWNIEFALHN